ncbi:MAG TPA: response regulator [Acetobacteraceae bacterium]|jgi:signal transduction histidine kinase|nr:response regulator [Acetobacteraceae bacterium]
MSGAATRILVVDDDAGGRYLKAHILRKYGYDVAEAATGRAAIGQCEASLPDLALVDMRLPDIHGVEVCKHLKAAFTGIAILQTSAAITSAHDRALALEGGADGFLVEPIEPEELLATVKSLIRMRGAEQALRQANETLENLVVARTRELTETNRRLEVEIAERRKAEDVLWHAQKLEAVGELTGGIAHDFNNLLAVIVLSMEMIRAAFEQDKVPARNKVLRLLTASEAAAERATTLTRQLLAFARRSTLKLGVVTLDEVIVGCEPFLRRALGETISFGVQSEQNLWPCRIDAAQFESVMLNLAVNARDAMPSGGELRIATSNVTIDAKEALHLGELAAGSYVLIKVADTGTGMDADVAARAFEPFFTTKDVGKGTGLGLSQVYGFIKQSGGHIRIDTKLGRGTTFSLYVPRCDPVEAAAPVQNATAEAPPIGNETVLVVEDNPEVLDLAVTTISELGYRVLTAVDGSSALDILRTEQPIDLLFSDVVMPGGMNGFELIDQARVIRGRLRALVTSGYANIHRPGTERPDVPLLLKPYHLGDLAKCIRMALDRS